MEVEWKEGIKYKIIYYHLLLTEERRWKRKKDKRRSKCRERERREKWTCTYKDEERNRKC